MTNCEQLFVRDVTANGTKGVRSKLSTTVCFCEGVTAVNSQISFGVRF